MGTTDSVAASLAIYDLMYDRAYRHALTYFAAADILFTDVQAEGNQLPTEYALIRQFNTVLDPATVSGNKRKQHSTMVVEFNVKSTNQRKGLELQTRFSHHMSAESLTQYDVVIDSITSNEYNNTHGAKFVTVIDFNYFVRV